MNEPGAGVSQENSELNELQRISSWATRFSGEEFESLWTGQALDHLFPNDEFLIVVFSQKTGMEGGRLMYILEKWVKV